MEQRLKMPRATTHTQQQPFYGPLSVTIRVSRYQKKHSPANHPDHHPTPISLPQPPRPTASSLPKPRTWQSLCTTSVHVPPALSPHPTLHTCATSAEMLLHVSAGTQTVDCPPFDIDNFVSDPDGLHYYTGLQRIQHSLARVVNHRRSRALHSATALLKQFHWLPVEWRIRFKLATDLQGIAHRPLTIPH